MTGAQRTNLLANKSRYLEDIAAIDRAVREIVVSGVSSATLSAGGGSRSYTRLDLPTLSTLRADCAGRVAAINRALAGGSPSGKRTIRIVRCV